MKKRKTVPGNGNGRGRLSHEFVNEFHTIEENEAVPWDKFEEWDNLSEKRFYYFEKEFLKPMGKVDLPEAFFYVKSPKIRFCTKVPEDVDERCRGKDKEVREYANCPDRMRSVICDFYGFRLIQGKKFMSMQNLVYGMRNPAMIDIKFGTRSHDPFVNKKKYELVTKAYPMKEKYGFRVVGMQLWKDKDTPIRNKKQWGRSLFDFKKQIEGEFIQEFVKQMTKKQKSFLCKEIGRIETLWKKFGTKEIIMFSTSICICFETASHVGNDELSEGFNPDRIEIKFVDFNHSFYREDFPTVEDGVLFGIKNFRRGVLNVLKGGKNGQ